MKIFHLIRTKISNSSTCALREIFHQCDVVTNEPAAAKLGCSCYLRHVVKFLYPFNVYLTFCLVPDGPMVYMSDCISLRCLWWFLPQSCGFKYWPLQKIFQGGIWRFRISLWAYYDKRKIFKHALIGDLKLKIYVQSWDNLLLSSQNKLGRSFKR